MNIIECAERVERILAVSPHRAENPSVTTAVRMALAVAIQDAYEAGREAGIREPLPLLPHNN